MMSKLRDLIKSIEFKYNRDKKYLSLEDSKELNKLHNQVERDITLLD